MLEPIDKVGVLRRLLGHGLAASGRRVAAGKADGAQVLATASGGLDMRERIVAQMRAIDPAWPDAETRALEVHVRAMLTETFGGDVANDPGFGGLLADVTDAIRQHAQFDALADYLRQQL